MQRGHKETGIKFMKAEGESLFDIKFKNGVIKIQKLNINDETKPFLRNLLVYEQFSSMDVLYQNSVTDYMNLMECLTASRINVGLICQHGIIDNCICDDQVIANIFNTIGSFLVLSRESCYSHIFCNVNEHCSRCWKDGWPT